MAKQPSDTDTRKPTVEDAIIEVREHEVVVDTEVLDELAKDRPRGRACGIVKVGFPVSSSDYDEDGRYEE